MEKFDTVRVWCPYCCKRALNFEVDGSGRIYCEESVPKDVADKVVGQVKDCPSCGKRIKICFSISDGYVPMKGVVSREGVN